jgi:hypothetical protein
MPALDVAWDDPRNVLLALLAAAHLASDLVPARRGSHAHEYPTFRARFAGALCVHAVVLAVAWIARPWPGLALIAASACVHALLANIGPRVLPRELPGRLYAFLTLQALHAAVVVAAWSLWPDLGDARHRLPPWLGPVAAAVAVFAFNVDRGSNLVSIVLRGLRDEDQPSGSTSTSGAGRLIGILERWVLVTLILLGQWGGIGFVLAAKSVARFKELEANRHFAEVYLVGTMTSVVIAMATGALLRALV